MVARSNSYVNVLPIVYRAPTRPFANDGWTNAIANGTLSHLPSEQVRAYSALYDQVAGFDFLQEEETKAAAKLTPLGFDRTLDSQSRITMISLLGEVDRINALMALNASQIIEAVRALRLEFPAREIEAGRRELLAVQRSNTRIMRYRPSARFNVASYGAPLGSAFPPKADIRLKSATRGR